jgi:hypothetical protein
MAYQSETHGTSASCEDSTPKDTRQISSPSYYVIKVHDQYNKDNVQRQHLSYKNQIILGYSTWMRIIHTCPILSYLTRMRVIHTRPITGYSTWMRVNEHSSYPRLFNLDESKHTLTLSQVIQLG